MHRFRTQTIIKPPPRSVLLLAAETLEKRARMWGLKAEGIEHAMDFRLHADPKEAAREVRAQAEQLRDVARWLDYSVDGPRSQAGC